MLKCRKTFIQSGYTIAAGETFEGLASVEDWMLSSFPAHFEKSEAVADKPKAAALPKLEDTPAEVTDAVVEEVKDFIAPPKDKAIKKPYARK